MGTLWAGIDEAGYGPNLGPFVMSIVVAEGEYPDLWHDCAGRIGRAGSGPSLLWVDDSKRVYHSGDDLGRLNAATFAVLRACDRRGCEQMGTGISRRSNSACETELSSELVPVCSQPRPVPSTSGGLLKSFGAGSLEDVELSLWLAPGCDPMIEMVPSSHLSALCSQVDDRWHLVAARSVVIGPARFNQELDRTGSKAAVHFDAFASLLGWLWEATSTDASATSDKHGGRHFYLGPLSEAFPDVWIDRGPEGPDLSQYVLRSGPRRLEVRFQPRADAANGLVALASLISKALREHWMAAFNAYWQAVLPGLKPTAGYPVDAARFRAIIEPECQARGLVLDQWWRKK